MLERWRNATKKDKRTVRVVLINEKSEVLLLKKSQNSNAQGLHEVPGGGIEKRDKSFFGKTRTIKNAAIRELREETGLRIRRRDIKIIGGFDYQYQGKKDETPQRRKVEVAVVRVKGRPEITVTEANDNKHISAGWFGQQEISTSEARDKLSGNTRPILPTMLDFAQV